MKNFGPEARGLLEKEIKRQKAEGILKEYSAHVDVAEKRFQAHGQAKEVQEKDLVLADLRAKWEAMKTAGDDDELGARLDAYFAKGQEIERWLGLADKESEKPANGARREQGETVADKITSISPDDPNRWGKLLSVLREAGGLKDPNSGQEFPFEILMNGIDAVRQGKAGVSKVPEAGGLREKISAFFEQNVKMLEIRMAETHPEDPRKWARLQRILDEEVREFKGNSRDTVYTAAELQNLIHDAYTDNEKVMKIPNAGRLRDMVVDFIRYDKAPNLSEQGGFRVGDLVSGLGGIITEAPVIHVGTKIWQFKPTERGRRNYTAIEGSSQYRRLVAETGSGKYSASETAAPKPSAEIPGPDELDPKKTIVVALDQLQHSKTKKS